MSWNIVPKDPNAVAQKLPGDLDEDLEGSLTNRRQAVETDLQNIPVDQGLAQMLNRGMPGGIPAWAQRQRQDLGRQQAPGFGSSAGLAQALEQQYAGDPTRGAMADYRYGLASRLAQGGGAPSYAQLAAAGMASGAASGRAQAARSEGLLDALNGASGADNAINASNASWALSREGLGRKLAGMATADKREQYNRFLDDARNAMFKGQIDMRRNLADNAARNNAYRNLAGGIASTAGTAAALWPGGEGEEEGSIDNELWGLDDEMGY